MILLVATASASQWQQLPALETLAERSRSVVVGTIESAESAPSSYGLSTTYEIRVSETMRGAQDDLVVLELPGGRWDGLTQRFSGVPLWEVGDQVLVFVPQPGSRPSLAGLFTFEGDQLVNYSTGWTSSAPMSGMPSILASPSTSTSTTSR